MKTTLIDNGDQKVWQSGVLSNGEFNYRLSVQITDIAAATGDDSAEFDVSVYVSKCVDSLTEHQKQQIIDTVGDVNITDNDILEYGYCARIDNANSVTYNVTKTKALMAKNAFIKQFHLYESLLGFYLDKPQNRIGNSGWDFLAGVIG